MVCLSCVLVLGAIGPLLNRVLQPRPLLVLGLNVWMGTAAGADELVEIQPLRLPFLTSNLPPI